MNPYSDETDVKEAIILTDMKPLNAPDIRRRLIADKEEEQPNVVDGSAGIDVSLYSTKKNIAQGMLDLSLISANCSQLKYLLFHYDRDNRETYDYYFIINLACIAVSIGLQVIVGILLILNVRHNINVQRYQSVADTYSNLILIGVFLITVVNIFLSVFISAK